MTTTSFPAWIYALCIAAIPPWVAGHETTQALAETRAVAPTSRQDTLILGAVTDDPKGHYKRLKPIVDYAAARMRDLGIARGEVVLAKDNAEMVRHLQAGKVDWVTETLFSALEFVERAGAEIVLVREKRGAATYRTVFITRQDSPIHTLVDLRGRRLALEDRGSTTAYFIPLATLLDQGLRPVALDHPMAPSPPEGVGYAFAGAEINIATWVHVGLTDAGAYSNLDWEMPERTPPVLRQGLRIFHTTRALPRAVELLRPGLDPQLRARLVALLLNAHHDPSGRRALHHLQRTGQFNALDGAALEEIEEVRRLRAMIGAGN